MVKVESRKSTKRFDTSSGTGTRQPEIMASDEIGENSSRKKSKRGFYARTTGDNKNSVEYRSRFNLEKTAATKKKKVPGTKDGRRDRGVRREKLYRP